MGGVDGTALRPIGGGGIAQLNILGDIVGGRHHLAAAAARRSAMLPSSLTAVTLQRSPFFTQRRPVASSRLFARVTTSSPTPAL
ncbi:MAG TPA: hypothetical protein VG184_11790, partial [Acidimicrobiales bacterium]|nr:hypothetical protein [Acidimicrobiales bacterium]